MYVYTYAYMYIYSEETLAQMRRLRMIRRGISYIYTCIHIYVYPHICIYIHIYIYKHMHTCIYTPRRRWRGMRRRRMIRRRKFDGVLFYMIRLHDYVIHPVFSLAPMWCPSS